MKFQPITARAMQAKALTFIHIAFGGHAAREMTPSGSITEPETSLRWRREIVPKGNDPDILRWVNTFSAPDAKRITFSIPIDTIDTNNTGLIAEDENGEIFLCRQTTITQEYVSNRRTKRFAKGWRGPEYSHFQLQGDHNARPYFVCIPLSRGPVAVISAFKALFDGFPATGTTRTGKEAGALLWSHYAAIKNSLTVSEKAKIRRKKLEIQQMLEAGWEPDKAFQAALAGDD